MLCVLNASSAINRPVTHEKCKRDTLSLTSTFNHWLPTWNYTWPRAPARRYYSTGSCVSGQASDGPNVASNYKGGQTGCISVGKGAPARVAGLSSQVTDPRAFWAPSPRGLSHTLSQRPFLPLPSPQRRSPRQ